MKWMLLISSFFYISFFLLFLHSYNLKTNKWFKFKVWHLLVGIITLATPILNCICSLLMFMFLPPCIWFDGDYSLRWRKYESKLGTFFNKLETFLNKEVI